MRRATMIVVLLAPGALLGACAASGHSAVATPLVPAAATTRARAAVAAGTSARSERPLTKAQAKAFARAVNLRAADVPGFKVSSEHEHETVAEKRLERELLHCEGGVGGTRQLVEVGSKEFEHEDEQGDLGVQSGVTVEQTSALAAKELAAVRSARGRECFLHYLNQLFKGQKYRGANIGSASISSGTPPAPGTAGSFGWHISTTITLRGVRIPFYMDILGFVYGPAEVTLLDFAVPEPFPAATEQRLFSLLVERAKAHRLSY
jgi:hypothetical protein